VSGLDSAKKI
jgi:hypothetical protein